MPGSDVFLGNRVIEDLNGVGSIALFVLVGFIGLTLFFYLGLQCRGKSVGV